MAGMVIPPNDPLTTIDPPTLMPPGVGVALPVVAEETTRQPTFQEGPSLLTAHQANKALLPQKLELCLGSLVP